MQPFERLSMDFKGPLPLVHKNYYLLTVVDEYLRLPFASARRNMETKTVIQCMIDLFTTYGHPSLRTYG